MCLQPLQRCCDDGCTLCLLAFALAGGGAAALEADEECQGLSDDARIVGMLAQRLPNPELSAGSDSVELETVRLQGRAGDLDDSPSAAQCGEQGWAALDVPQALVCHAKEGQHLALPRVCSGSTQYHSTWAIDSNGCTTVAGEANNVQCKEAQAPRWLAALQSTRRSVQRPSLHEGGGSALFAG